MQQFLYLFSQLEVFLLENFTFGKQDEKIISWYLCKIYVHKDMIKELENTDILHSVIFLFHYSLFVLHKRLQMR